MWGDNLKKCYLYPFLVELMIPISLSKAKSYPIMKTLLLLNEISKKCLRWEFVGVEKYLIIQTK